jgi:hypothetical protein
MIIIKIVRISENPKFIIVSQFVDIHFHYHMADLSTRNKMCDIGFWRIKPLKIVS